MVGRIFIYITPMYNFGGTKNNFHQTLNNFSPTVNLPFNPLLSAGVLKGSKVKIYRQTKTIFSTTKNIIGCDGNIYTTNHKYFQSHHH